MNLPLCSESSLRLNFMTSDLLTAFPGVQAIELLAGPLTHELLCDQLT